VKTGIAPRKRGSADPREHGKGLGEGSSATVPRTDTGDPG